MDETPDLVINVQEVHAGVDGGSCEINVVDDDGKRIRLQIDLLQLSDLIEGAMLAIHADGKPVGGVCWNPEDNRVELFTGKEPL